MDVVTFTCPRCLFSEVLRPGLRFCPRCGLPDAKEACFDQSPVDIEINDRTFRIHDRIAVGSICTIYRCRFRFPRGGKEIEGVLKVARDPCNNGLVANEAAVLRRLRTNDAGQFAPFMPALEESFGFGDAPHAPRRQANVLRMHAEIHSPDELYTLAEVRAQYPAGLTSRDMAWIWRRLLSILGFAHSQDVVHGAVLPMHVLIEPREHKLVLVDWCCAVAHAAGQQQPVNILTGGYLEWYKRQGALRAGPSPELDVGFGARCMIELMGGDPVRGEFPSQLEPALQRYFERCLGSGAEIRSGAWKLLDDFDQLIHALWGPRSFRVLAMPPKTHGASQWR